MNNKQDMDTLATNHLAMKMKLTKLSLLGGIAILIGGAIMLGSCEGPEGPMGPAGTDGTDGTDGIDGVDGTDGTDGVAGNAVCMECHTIGVKTAMMDQWENSGHGSGSTTARGSRVGCAKCHSHEGFVETAWTGEEEPAAAPVYPQVIQCKTCHDFHKSLDFENEPNSAIRQEAEVTLMAYDVARTVGFDNTESNLCMHCHQARKAAFDDSDPTRLDTIPGHYGPHLSPQSDFLNGYGGYEFDGVVTRSSGYASHSCVGCHMGEVVGDTIGGHTWYADIEGCAECHGTDMEDAQTEVHDLLVDLEAALFAAGMVDDEGGAIESDEGDPDADPPEPPVWVIYEADLAGALWNYLYIEEEGSSGVHNAQYAIDLLTESIAVIEAAK